MRSIVREWRMAIEFLTRIPLPQSGQADFDENAFIRSVRWYPYIGLLIGAILAAFSYVFFTWLPPHAASVLLVIAGIVVTGGLHLDGLMDTADGLLSGRDRERKLAIMKDSRVGAMGVIAFVCLFALKWALFSAVGKHNPLLLLMMPAIGRTAMVGAIAGYPPARQEGMGVHLAGRVSSSQLALATSVLILPLLFWQVKGFVIICICWLAFWWMARIIARSLGGLTGDTYGAICEVLETVFLLTAVGVLL
ncbi:adenosylcobinamide-GDP ribazoletransferase [Effusibacillus consociatus]|uniref:Adenosylcobinamide-GDP ribazoletransferase n=1 Tax=Effusibacillus consociatus TaxID=1117041 RepID=A0ABV9PW76_9BACL